MVFNFKTKFAKDLSRLIKVGITDKINLEIRIEQSQKFNLKKTEQSKTRPTHDKINLEQFNVELSQKKLNIEKPNSPMLALLDKINLNNLISDNLKRS